MTSLVGIAGTRCRHEIALFQATPVTAVAVALGLFLSGCGVESDARTEAESVQSVQAPLVLSYNEFSPDTPGLDVNLGTPTSNYLGIAVRASNGSVRTFEKPHGVQWSDSSNAGYGTPYYTDQRAMRYWETAVTNNIGTWGVVVLDKPSGVLKDNVTSPPEVFPPGLSACNFAGPVSTLERADDAHFCAFFHCSNGRLEQACMIDQGANPPAWENWGFDPQDTNYPATSSPMAFRRSRSWAPGGATDSLWYSCGTGLTACEFRLGGAYNHNTFPMSFGNGAGSFADGTRPTAIANPDHDDSRWAFAVQDDGTTRRVIAQRDNATVNAAAPNYSSYWVVDSGASSTWTFSTPMPYIRTDGTVAVAYFANTTTGNVFIRQAVWDASTSSWPVTDIHDTGLTRSEMPVMSEPVPWGIQGPGEENVVLYRRPAPGASGAGDIVVIEETNGAWSAPTQETYLCVDRPCARGRSCESGSDCDTGLYCEDSDLQAMKVCVEPIYEYFDSTYDLRYWDEVTKLPTSDDPVWQINNYQLYEPTNSSVGSSEGSSLIYSDAVIADGWVEVDAHSTDNDLQGVIFRYQDPDHYYIFLTSETTWRFRRYDGDGVYTTLDSGYYSMDWSSTHNLKIEGRGPTLAAYIDGMRMATVTDSTYRSGRVGVWERNQVNAYFDNFHVANYGVRLRTTQVKADRDAILWGGINANGNEGTRSSWYVKGDSSYGLNNARKFGVGFDIQATGSNTVQSASLNIVDFVANDSTTQDKNVRVYGLNNSEDADDWDESAVTWNNFPGNNTSSATSADSSATTYLGTIVIEAGQDGGNHGLSLSNQALVDFLNSDDDGRVTFILTTTSGMHIGNVATRERSGSCGLQGSAQVGDCAPTLDITATDQ